MKLLPYCAPALLLSLGSGALIRPALVAQDRVALRLPLENEPPRVAAVLPPDEGFGTLLVELRARGREQGLVSFRVEYDVLGDVPDHGWQLARAVEDERTEGLALRDIRMIGEEMPLAFFWDTDADLPDREALVCLRFTPRDGSIEGAPVESQAFQVDND